MLRAATSVVAMQMLRRFKDEYADWRLLDCQNSIIELQPRLIYIYHVENAAVLMTGWIDRASPDWQRELNDVLHLNASRAAE